MLDDHGQLIGQRQSQLGRTPRWYNSANRKAMLVSTVSPRNTSSPIDTTAARGAACSIAGTITQVWGARFLLLVIWLSVPLAGLLLLRQDRQRFYEASRLQRADCLARAEMLRRYTFEMTPLGNDRQHR